jgi:hypothetical protein
MGFTNTVVADHAGSAIVAVAKSQGCVFNAHCWDALIVWTDPETNKQFTWAHMNDDEYIRLFDVDIEAVRARVRFTPLMLSNDYFHDDVDPDFFDKVKVCHESDLLQVALRCDAVDFVHRLHVAPEDGHYTYQAGMNNGMLQTVFSQEANLASVIFRAGESAGPFMHPTYRARDLDNGEPCCWSTQLRTAAVESAVCHATDVAFPGVSFVTAWMRNGEYFDRLQVLGVDTNAQAVNTLFGGVNMQGGVCSKRMTTAPIQVVETARMEAKPGLQAKLFNRRRLSADEDHVECSDASDSDWDDFHCSAVGEDTATFFKHANQWC